MTSRTPDSAPWPVRTLQSFRTAPVRGAFACMLFGLLTGCASVRKDFGLFRSMQENMHSNGKMKSRGEVESMSDLQIGPWDFWYRTGQERAEGEYELDDQTGHWVYWYKSGKKKMEGPYAGTQRNGLWTWYHREGGVRALGLLADDFEEGLWVYRTREGQLEQRGHYDRGRKTARWTHYSAEGLVQADGCYFEGEKVGTWIYRDANGKLSSATHEMPNDYTEIVREDWAPGGGLDATPRREGYLSRGERHGRWTTYHPNGAPRITGDFYRGKPFGDWVAWSAEGLPLAYGKMRDGEVEGDWIEWLEGECSPLSAEWIAPGGGVSRDWSRADIVDEEALEDVILTWLAEIESPIDDTLLHVEQEIETTEPPPPEVVAVSEKEAEKNDSAQPGFTDSELDKMEDMITWFTKSRKGVRATSGPYGGPARAPSRGMRSISEPLVGKPFPVKSIVTLTNGRVDLETLRGKKALFLVLRGVFGKVCVYCATQTKALVPFYPELEKLNTRVFVVYPGKLGQLENFLELYYDEFGEESKPPYDMVYDADLSLTQALGIQHELARPTTIIVDEKGIVRWSYVGKDLQDRPAAEDLVERIKGMDAD